MLRCTCWLETPTTSKDNDVPGYGGSYWGTPTSGSSTNSSEKQNDCGCPTKSGEEPSEEGKVPLQPSASIAEDITGAYLTENVDDGNRSDREDVLVTTPNDPVMVAGSYLVDSEPISVHGKGDQKPMDISDISQQGTPTCSFASILGSLTKTSFNLANSIRFVRRDGNVYEYDVKLFEPNMSDTHVRSVDAATWVRVKYSPTEGSHHASDWNRDLAKGDGGEIWPVLLHRAYLKKFATRDDQGEWLKGDYQFRGFAFAAITGRMGQSFEIADAQPEIRSGLWGGDVVTVGSPGNDKKQIVDGIAQNHAYTVVDLDGSGSNAQITLRNPWGTDSDEDAMKIRSQFDGERIDAHDGYITLAWSDFVSRFSQPGVNEVFVGTVS